MIRSVFKNFTEIKEHLIIELNVDNSVTTLQKIPSEQHVETVLKWLCSVPKYTTYRVNTLKTSSEYISRLISSEMCKQAAMRGDVNCPLVSTHPTLPELVILGNWDEDILDLTHREQEIIVDTICGAAVLRGAHVYAPGIMGIPAGVQDGNHVSVFADLVGKCKQGLQSSYNESKMFIGNGIARMGRKQLYGKDITAKGIAVEMTDIVSGCPALDVKCIPTDLILLQNLPSVVCGQTLDPQPKEMVLDMCAAPGNKTTHLAMLMKDQGLIVALDKTKSKVNSIQNRCLLFSIHCVRTYVCDATKSVVTANIEKNVTPSNEAICSIGVSMERSIKDDHCLERKSEVEETTESVRKEAQDKEKRATSRVYNVLLNGPPYPPETFDKILLDAPCSALGQRPQLFNRISLKQLKSYPSLQQNLFQAAVALLKRGGSLVYSTCTVTVAENEGLVCWALATFPCLKLKPIILPIGGPGLDGVGLTEGQRQCVRRFGPVPSKLSVPNAFDQDTIGFFIACFLKQ